MNAYQTRLILALESGPKSTRELSPDPTEQAKVWRRLESLRLRGFTSARIDHDKRGRHQMHALTRAGYLIARAVRAVAEDSGSENWWESQAIGEPPSPPPMLPGQIVAFDSEGNRIG